MTYAEWVEQKKREKAKKSSSYSEWVETTRDVNLDDIAPVKTTTSEEEDNKWYDGYFQKSSVFDDGYQFGDITKARDAFHQDVAENLLTGVVGMGEKIVDFGAWLLPAMAGGIGSQSGQGFDFDLYNEVKEDITPFMEKDLYDEKKVSQTILLHDQWERYNGMELDEASVLDYKSDSLVQSLGQLAATAPTGNLWWLVTGATAFGGQAEEALKEGATFEEAGASAAIAAGAEVLTERIGGIKFGKNGLTFADEVIKPLTNKISNKVVKALVDMGIDAASEGFEELITEVCNNLGSSLYKEEDAWTLLTNEEAVNGYIDSFVGGAALGGMFGVGNLANNTVKLTESEQKVVDKVTEDRIAEKAKEGKVSEALKIKIREEVTEDMDHGRIPMDTIEEVLGGDTYKSYKDTIDSEEALKKELEDLNGMKTGDLTGVQSDRLAELKGMNLSDTSKRDGLKTQLRSEVYQMTKGSRLGNSYDENYKRTQSFTADLSKYDTKQQEVIKKAIESGILNDTRRIHEFVDMVAKISADKGVPFDFANNAKLKESGFAIDGKTINGFKNGDGITVNIDSVKSLNSVVGHEITHVLEGTEFYEKLQTALFDYAKTKNDYQGRYDSLYKLYEGIYESDGEYDAKIKAEVTADLVGDYLFTDQNFVNKLYAKDRNVFQKVWDEIKYLWKTATAGSKEARELEKVKRAFEKAWRENGSAATDSNAKYSIASDQQGEYVRVDVNQNIFVGKDIREMQEIARKLIRDNFKGQVLPVGERGKAYVNKRSADEYAYPANRRMNDDIKSAKMQSAPELDNLLKVSTFVENQADDGRHPQATGGWDIYSTRFEVGGTMFSGEVKIMVTDRGYVFYDITQIEKLPVNGGQTEVDSAAASGNLSNNSISQNTKNATRFSLSEDSDSNYLSAVERGDMDTAQKMVDEVAKKAGYDIEGYHGTDEDFWTFSLENRGRNGEMLGVGYYFTADKKMADMYTNNSGKVKHVYLDIKKPINTKELMITPEEWGKFLDYAEKHKNEYIESVWKGNSINKDFELRYMSDFENDAELIKTFIDTTAGRNATVAEGYLKMLKDSIGYDGVNYQNGDAKVYVTFTPEQIKSADNVTYDDSGNVITLSERFNVEKKDIRYSMSGTNAKTANSSMLLRAEHLLDTGVDSETVRKETGWYKGYDGRMRFEIDDSKSELIENPNLEKHENDGTAYFTGKLSDILNHDDLYEAYPQLRNVNIIIQETEPGTRGIYQPNSNYLTLSLELFKRHTKEYEGYFNGDRQAEIERIEQTPEYKEYNKWYEDEELTEKLDPETWLEGEKEARDKFFNSELGKRYHQLKWGKVNIQKFEFGWGKEAREVLMHEIQHAIQKIENFSSGSSPGYWRRVLASGDTIQTAEQKAELREAENKLYAIYKQNPEFYGEMINLLYSTPKMPRGKIDWETFEQIEDDPIEWQEFDKKRDALEEKYGDSEVFDFMDMYYNVERYRARSLDADDAYYNTAGEIEARDTANRLNLTAEERRNKRPDIDNKRVVFTDRYSLSDSTETPKEYGKWNIYGKDIMLETEDIAPVSKTETTVAENATVAPVMEESATEDNGFLSEGLTEHQTAFVNKKMGSVATPEPVQADSFTPKATGGTAPIDTSLGGEGRGTNRISHGASSDVSNNIIPQNTPSVNPTEATSDKETPSGEMRSWAETSTESEAVGRAILPDDLDAEKIYYQPISNKKTLGNANARLDSLGYEDAVTYFNGQFANKNISLDDVALGERLIQEAVKKGDYKTAGELITDISILGTELGQKVQALSIIKRLTPEGQLRAIQRTIERGKTKGDKVFEGVEVTQDMTDQILKTYKEDGTYDQNELNAAVENVKQQIADQMEVTRLEKVNAWRYLSMLGNPKTHIRNLVSNIAMKGTVAVKNAIARTVEDIAPIKNRTKTWKRSTDTVKEFSRQKAVELKEVISGGGKYGESAEIKAKREIFKNKILKGVYGFNSEMLSKEDWWFSRPAFTNALSECLTANGIRTQEDIDGNPEMVEKAIKYALDQAQIATFQQTSWLANKIGEMERKNTLTNIAVGSILPFKKTPINIAKTGLNYSLLGFAKTAYDYVVQKKNGEVNASELIDSLAQNTTGTALMMIGYMLAKAGFLNGAGEDDKEGKYDYQLGEQAYSINFGGSTYSLSWLSPVAMPLFVGVNMYEQFVEKNEWNGNVVIETMAKTLDPLSEMSFLSSLDSTLSSYDSGIMKFAGIFETAAQSYIGQFAPTLGSQIATVIDDTKRTTKVSGNSGNTFAEETINKLIYKIPFLRETLEPSIDIWGNEIKQTENVMERAFETFLAPYAKRDDISSDVDAEIKDLYAQTGDNGLIPSAPYNYINYSGEKYNMSAKEYTDFKKEYGQTAFELLDELFNTTSYRNADSETKADMVNKVYDYARDEAKRDFFSDRGIKYDYEEDLIKGAIENDMVPDEYAFSIKYPKKYDFFKNNGISYDDYADADEDGKRAYTWAYENPGKYTMSKAFSDDFLTYYGYRDELNDIEADKDEDGKSISGSKKEKVISYINDMNLDYGQKIILFRSMYSSKEDRANYNADIVEYLNSRDDISYEEMVTILEELDMKVSSDGSVTWD